MPENFDLEFIALLAEMNLAVAEAAEPVEGNLFYEHHTADFPHSSIIERFAVKRANLLAACYGRGKVLEIGVNAGHSALLMLYHNPKLHYVGVDICEHQYTRKAMEFLQKKFPDRVEFLVGDSIEVLPEIAANRPDLRFDVVHVDGLHTVYHCTTDTHNSLALCSPFAWVIVDDTDLAAIKAFYDELIANKILLPKKPDGWTWHYAHEIGMTPT